MKLFATGRDLFGVPAPDYGRLKGRFVGQCNFSLFVDAQIATIPPLTCHKSANTRASCPTFKGQTRRAAAAFSGQTNPQTPPFMLTDYSNLCPSRSQLCLQTRRTFHCRCSNTPSPLQNLPSS